MSLTYYKNVKNKLKAVVSDKSIKPAIQIVFELLRTAIATRSLPRHYFVSGLYRKGVSDYLDYLTKKECFEIQALMRDKNKKQILDNKYFFQKFFDQTKIRIPEMLAYNFGNMFFVGHQKIQVENKRAFYSILNKLVEQSESGSIIMKPMLGAFGEEINKITTNDLINDELKEKEELFQKTCSGNFIFQVTIKQHPDINRIYPHSLNTVRMDAFIDDEGRPEIVSALMRFGRDGRHVDNITAGGIFVGIDTGTACLRKTGMTFLKKGAYSFTHHPDSGTEYDKLKIPYFDEAKLMAREAAQLLNYRLVGWDIGISDKGPVLIEGNAWYHISMMEMANGGYRRHPVFMKVIDEAMRKKNSISYKGKGKDLNTLGN
jgi:hypothetical protein